MYGHHSITFPYLNTSVSPPICFDSVLARSSVAPRAQECARGKLTFALAVCKWQLVLDIEMKRVAGGRTGKYLSSRDQ